MSQDFSDNKEIKLTSGNILNATMVTFSDGRNLYQSIIAELNNLNIDVGDQIDINFIKGIFCQLIISKEIEKNIWTCFNRTLYKKNKITLETFEPIDARGDYIEACMEICWFNLEPFIGGLFVKLSGVTSRITDSFHL